MARWTVLPLTLTLIACSGASSDETTSTPASCTDASLNGAETGVDCGGSECGPCADDADCKEATDCESGVCAAGRCQAPSCGEGTVNGNEECDDGGESKTCDSDCTMVSCGDGTTNTTAGEECDDSGESINCDDDCTTASCGDGTSNTAAGEQCDDGGESKTCNSNCTTASCGDGTINMTAGEQCDDTGESMTCDDDCTMVSCGDGTTNMTAGEHCDGAGESMTCNDDCTTAACGDGKTNASAGEGCDDGNQDNTDSCPDGMAGTCQPAMCGDGFILNGMESCDGNGMGMGGETASCDTDCTAALCGDGLVNATSGEDCDGDGMGMGGETATCDTDCSVAECGDGVTNASAGEECDDNNKMDGDGCDSNCKSEYCFKLDNTNLEDLTGADWFDKCVDAVGTQVEIIVRDPNKVIVYQGKGTKGTWTYNNLTSTSINQYNVANHNPILLDNGDLLRISGKNASNAGCGGSMGNGYVIVTYDNPVTSTYYNKIKLLVAPYKHTVGGASVRNFGNWSASREISWNNDNDQYSCHPLFGTGPSLTPYIGSVEVKVF